jgi:hypothetical protein
MTNPYTLAGAGAVGAAGAFGAGMANSDDQESFTGYLAGEDSGALGGAALGVGGAAAGVGSILGLRGLGRAAHMLLGTDKGRALMQQANAADRSGLRHAFGGFRGSNKGALNDLASYQTARSNAINQGNVSDAMDEYSKELGIGGYGLDATQAAGVKNKLNDLTKVTDANSGYTYDGLKGIKQKADLYGRMRDAELSGYGDQLKAGLRGAGVGAAGSLGAYGYSNDFDTNNMSLTGAASSALAGGLAGGLLNRSGVIQNYGKALTSLGDTARQRFSQQLASSPKLRQQELLRYADEIASSDPARANDIRAKVRAVQTGTARAAENSLAVVDGNINFISGQGAGKDKLNISSSIAKDLGARDPDMVSAQINKSMQGLGKDTETVNSILANGGPEAQQMSEILNAHSKQLVNISNKAQDEMAEAVRLQGMQSSRNYAGLGGLPGAGGAMKPEYLMNQPAMKQLAKDVASGTPVDTTAIADALKKSGITMPDDELAQMANGLSNNFKAIGDKVRTNLDEASNSMQMNIRSTGTNLAAESHNKAINTLNASIERAKSVFPQEQITKFQAEGNDYIELLNKSGPDGQREARKIMSDMQKALDSGDASRLQQLTTEYANKVDSLSSGVAGFTKAREGVVNSARKALKGNSMPDDFADNIKQYLNPSDTSLAQQVDNIASMSSQSARNAYMSGSVKNIRADDFDSVHELATNLGITSPNITPAVATKIPGSTAQEILTNLSSVDPKQLNAAINGDSKAIKKINSVMGATLDQADIKELNNNLKTYKNLVDTAIKDNKDLLAASTSTGKSSIGMTPRNIATRQKVTLDDEGLASARRSATEAPVLSTKAPVADDGVNARGFTNPYLLGALGLGGAGLGTYYATRPTQAPVEENPQ